MSTDTPCNVSIVIPAYNEAGVIGHAMRRVASYFAGLPLSWEMIVVDDGSRDATAAEAQRAAEALIPHHIRILHHRENQGKGASVKTGVLASAGQFVVFCDADGATPIEEFGKFLPLLQDGADLVAGSRRIAGAAIQRHQRRLRQWMGGCYTRITNWLVAPGVSDITCGFKAMRRATAQAVFSRARVTGWSFDAELFFLARHLRYQVREVPVTWTDQPNTKVRMLRDAVTSLWELAKIRWRAFRGAYGPPDHP